MTARDAILNSTLRLISQGDLNLDGIPDVQKLFNQLRKHRSKLVVDHPLKNVVLPDELPPVNPIRTRKINRNCKLGTKLILLVLPLKPPANISLTEMLLS